MRLVKALSDDKGKLYDVPRSTLNRTGTHPIQVTINVVKSGVLAVFEANISDPMNISFKGPLFKSLSVDEVENFVADHGYNLNPEEWYPG